MVAECQHNLSSPEENINNISTRNNEKMAELTLSVSLQTYYKIIFTKEHIYSNLMIYINIDILIEYVYMYKNTHIYIHICVFIYLYSNCVKNCPPNSKIF